MENNGLNRLSESEQSSRTRIETLYDSVLAKCASTCEPKVEPDQQDGLCGPCSRELALMAIGVTIEETVKRFPILRLSKERIYEQAEEFWNGEQVTTEEKA